MISVVVPAAAPRKSSLQEELQGSRISALWGTAIGVSGRTTRAAEQAGDVEAAPPESR